MNVQVRRHHSSTTNASGWNGPVTTSSTNNLLAENRTNNSSQVPAGDALHVKPEQSSSILLLSNNNNCNNCNNCNNHNNIMESHHRRHSTNNKTTKTSSGKGKHSEDKSGDNAEDGSHHHNLQRLSSWSPSMPTTTTSTSTSSSTSTLGRHLSWTEKISDTDIHNNNIEDGGHEDDEDEESTCCEVDQNIVEVVDPAMISLHEAIAKDHNTIENLRRQLDELKLEYKKARNFHRFEVSEVHREYQQLGKKVKAKQEKEDAEDQEDMAEYQRLVIQDTPDVIDEMYVFSLQRKLCKALWKLDAKREKIKTTKDACLELVQSYKDEIKRTIEEKTEMEHRLMAKLSKEEEKRRVVTDRYKTQLKECRAEIARLQRRERTEATQKFNNDSSTTSSNSSHSVIGNSNGYEQENCHQEPKDHGGRCDSGGGGGVGGGGGRRYSVEGRSHYSSVCSLASEDSSSRRLGSEHGSARRLISEHESARTITSTSENGSLHGGLSNERAANGHGGGRRQLSRNNENGSGSGSGSGNERHCLSGQGGGLPSDGVLHVEIQKKDDRIAMLEEQLYRKERTIKKLNMNSADAMLNNMIGTFSNDDDNSIEGSSCDDTATLTASETTAICNAATSF